MGTRNYALEKRLRKRNYQWVMDSYVDAPDWAVRCADDDAYRREDAGIWSGHPSRLIAMCLAALRALGVKFVLTDGWNQR